MFSLRKTAMATGVLGALLLAGSANAQVSGLSGGLVYAGTPAGITDLRENFGAESDSTSWLYLERSGLLLGGAQSVNINAQGSYASNGSLTGGTIAGGQFVDTYIFHTNPVGNGPITYNVSMTFDSQILGLIVLGEPTGQISLEDTDATLGNLASFRYENQGSRGFELGQDAIVSWSGNTLQLRARTTSAVDQVRIITKARTIPEPGTVALLGIGLLGGILIRRRK